MIRSRRERQRRDRLLGSRPVGRLSAAVLLLPLVVACDVPRSLNPAGPAARRISDLWWLMFWVSLVVFVGVIIALIVAMRRREAMSEEEGAGLGRRLVTWGGVLIPGVIVVGLMAYTIYTIVELEAPDEPSSVTIEVRSHMFWWQADYADYGFATANEIHIPAGRPVEIVLIGSDVIHSFWVPELHGKRDLTPGHRGEIWIEADNPGSYRGQCAEFCGLQHARMQFLVIAHDADAFESWLEQQQQPAPEPETPLAFRGQQVFLGSECVYCHTVRGTNATGTLGPDLTTIASRRELGAGTLPNTIGNLAAWTVDAQQFKPGNHMPRMPLPSEDLQAMLAYLQTLR